MALTRSLLKSMGIEDEKIDQIIESHSETVEALKKQRDDFKAEADKVPALEKKLEESEASEDDGYKEQYEALVKEYANYKGQVETEKAEAERKALYRDALKDAGIDADWIDRILKVADLSGIEVKDGAIADPDKVAEAIKTEWGGYVTQQQTKGASVPNPPEQEGSSFDDMSLAEKMRYANENPGDAAVAAWLGVK